jgi:DNA-binding NtrC family response regulator
MREIRDILRRVLEVSGYAVSEAEDATTALDQLEKCFFNVVLLDIHLPDISGLEALKRIKKINQFTKVVMVTGDGSLPTAVDALDSQAFAFLEKPVDMKDLMRTLSRALTEQREELFTRKPLSARLNLQLAHAE